MPELVEQTHSVHGRRSGGYGGASASQVENRLAPTLEPGDVVILDNLSVRKSPYATKILPERGAWFLFLPAYTPHSNPIVMAFSKSMDHLPAASARTFDDLVFNIGSNCGLYTAQECWNFMKVAGYASKKVSDAQAADSSRQLADMF